MKNGLSVERISPFSFCYAKEAEPETHKQEHQGLVKSQSKHGETSQNETIEETKVNWHSKIEALEANQEVLAASIAKANEEIFVLLARFSGCARDSVGLRNTTLQCDSTSGLEKAAGAPVCACDAGSNLAGFRFATVMEVHARPSLVGMHVV